MPKGQIPMRGRMMAGSHAVIAHNEAGHALFVPYYPPDLPLSPVIVAYCQQGALATGTALLVIDRAVNAGAMACAFDAQGLGWLSMLDDNEPQGLESFAAMLVGTLEDGTQVSSGPWHGPRPDDPRDFVMGKPAEGKTLGDWGTPKVQDVLTATEWPRVDRARNEIQENAFKRLIDHGALNTNDGRKTIGGPDRPQQRAREKLDQSLMAAQKRLDKQTEAMKTHQHKVVESEHKGHGQRLEQRQRALAVGEKESKDAQAQHATLAAQALA